MTAIKKTLPRRRFDAVIVGAGGSGMRAALQLSEAGLSVAVLSKVFPTRSHTVAAQGGIGASLGNMSEDNWHYHFYDTIKGSDWLGDQDAIEFMCREAPKVVYELEHFGMPFDRNADGTIYQRPFGGHTANYGEKPVQRACAAADRTGHAMLHTLYQRNVRAKTHFFVEWLALDLIRDAEGDVVGVTALEMETGEIYILEAKITLMATGGAGRIWAASTNAYINTGDGMGMAARAGLPLEDMEFWQFHPTGVAGAIHYQMGGIPTNIHGQVVIPKNGNPNTIVNGLYAIGECSCVSVHGANRLGTNSLLDLLVFGRAAGNHVVQANLKAREHKPLPADAGEYTLARIAKLDNSSSGEYAQDLANDIRKTMQTYAGVFRNQGLLDEGVRKMAELTERAKHVWVKDKSQIFNTARIEALEIDNLIQTANSTMISAAARKESRGAHAHDDHPKRDDANWMKHTLWYEGNRLDYKPVQLKPLTVESVPPKERTF
ncbi:MAG: FAD-binding protein [Burkholderiaceae bacterium]|nr:FAD-binding protein [Burkholderiaceae bacterium]